MDIAASLPELGARTELRRIALACGVFDGVHRGHQQIIRELCRLAARTQAVPTVLTFEPHPRAVLSDEPPERLTVREQQLRLLSELGVRAAVILPFTRELAALPPGLFLSQYILRSEVEITGICVGSQWRFGSRGRGDTAFLEAQGRALGFDVVSVPELMWYGKPVSSTRIRRAIRAGRLETAARMLGRPYSMHGTVQHGRGLGNRALHCPTANLQPEGVVLPPNGVYAGCARLPGDDRKRPARAGIIYVGRAPTVTRALHAPALVRPVVEVHLFDGHSDLYGKDLEVEFAHHVRGDRVFPSLDALAEQIQRDICVAREWLAAH